MLSVSLVSHYRYKRLKWLHGINKKYPYTWLNIGRFQNMQMTKRILKRSLQERASDSNGNTKTSWKQLVSKDSKTWPSSSSKSCWPGGWNLITIKRLRSCSFQTIRWLKIATCLRFQIRYWSQGKSTITSVDLQRRFTENNKQPNNKRCWFLSAPSVNLINLMIFFQKPFKTKVDLISESELRSIIGSLLPQLRAPT